MKRGVLVLLLSVLPAGAVELHIRFGALERMLAEQVFTQEGRRYVRGDKNTKCNFAYLEKPQIRAEDGRLQIRAKFTGRSSLNMFGQCVGLGDAFDLVIGAAPQYHDGGLRLQAVKVTSEHKTGYYIRRVCTALEASLARDFHYAVEAEARKLLEAPDREIHKFNVPEIRVSNDALVLVVEFELTVK